MKSAAVFSASRIVLALLAYGGKAAASRRTPKGGRLGAEEDGLALEGFEGEEEGDGGVDGGGGEDESDGAPVVGAGDDFLADEAGVEDGDERELGRELDTGHDGSDGRDDDDEGQGSEIALGLFVGFGEERDGHEQRGEEDR